MKKLHLITFSLIIILFLSFSTNNLVKSVNYYDYDIINSYHHDKNAFTQGLIYKNGYLFEGTGLKGESSLRKIKLDTGEIVKIHYLKNKYFGEGITMLNNKIYQLTWKENTGFIYNFNFEIIDKFSYPTEGWGLTNNGKELIMSDGSSKLYFLDPKTLKKKKEMTVTKNNKKISNINELEYIKGKIFANIWQKNHLIIINPENAKVTGILDLEGIINRNNYTHNINVLNGIAYDSKNNRIFITGKLWPKIFEIEIFKK